MMLKDLLLLASLLFLALAIIYHLKQEHEYKKWLRDLEHPVDSLVIKKGK